MNLAYSIPWNIDEAYKDSATKKQIQNLILLEMEYMPGKDLKIFLEKILIKVLELLIYLKNIYS